MRAGEAVDMIGNLLFMCMYYFRLLFLGELLLFKHKRAFQSTFFLSTDFQFVGVYIIRQLLMLRCGNRNT